MKNQYFGDVNDYRKYGLLRALQGAGNLSLAVAWMLTPDDGSADGGSRRYLQEPGKWRHHDPLLFDHVSDALSDGTPPAVAMIEESSLLQRARFLSATVPDERSGRAQWGERLIAFTAGADLVFLDPDNGFETRSGGIGRKGSSKYAAWCEVERLWEAGSSVLVYQHYRRVARSEFNKSLAVELRRRTGSPFVEAFCTPHVVFMLAAQRRHSPVFREAIARRLPKWQGQIAVAGLADAGASS